MDKTQNEIAVSIGIDPGATGAVCAMRILVDPSTPTQGTVECLVTDMWEIEQRCNDAEFGYYGFLAHLLPESLPVTAIRIMLEDCGMMDTRGSTKLAFNHGRLYETCCNWMPALTHIRPQVWQHKFKPPMGLTYDDRKSWFWAKAQDLADGNIRLKRNQADAFLLAELGLREINARLEKMK